MGEVVPFRPRPVEEDSDAAFMAFSRALVRAQTTGRLRDMAEAIRTYELWLFELIPDPVERQRVWP